MKNAMIVFMAFCLLGLSMPEAASAQCPAYQPFAVERMRGVRTRWETVVPPGSDLKAKDKRASLVPNLGNLWLVQWANELIKQGANVAELNLEPGRQLSKTPLLPNTILQQYTKAYHVAFRHRDATQRAQVDAARPYFRENRYTPAQRNELLLDFLARLEALRQANKLGANSATRPAPFQFLLHQREWFPPNESKATRDRRVNSFVQDMSGFINAARQRCLDHWIAGVRLGEHANANMYDFLPLLVRLATAINANTSGWLKTRLFLANGGGHGAEYLNIHKAHAQYRFYPKIAAQTRAFAIGYKWMKFAHPTNPALQFITNWMESYDCDPGAAVRRCKRDSKEDWKFYLRQGLGFDDLQYFINQSLHPNHAHVVFVGDSSDSVQLMTTLTTVGGVQTLQDDASLQAVRELFDTAKWDGKYAARWNGRHLCQHSTTVEGAADTDLDEGFSLYEGDGSRWGTQTVERPLTIQKWNSWPVSP